MGLRADALFISQSCTYGVTKPAYAGNIFLGSVRSLELVGTLGTLGTLGTDGTNGTGVWLPDFG